MHMHIHILYYMYIYIHTGVSRNTFQLSFPLHVALYKLHLQVTPEFPATRCVIQVQFLATHCVIRCNPTPTHFCARAVNTSQE